MTPDAFRAAALAAEPPPPGLSLPLQALWWDARGDWDRAHECAQASDDADAAAVHAYLHRREGDLANAGYWYRRAGRAVARGELAEEWAGLVEEFSPQGQATFAMANLRPQTTGLPFVVYISQKAGARHDVRVKVSSGPKVLPSQMSSYALRPFRCVEGVPLSGVEEKQLELWLRKNQQVLIEYWDGDIEYTEDAISQIVSI